jgi:NAD(P)-dependent dehydrogenase (short-subunit alcohol dehydrogenase family)
MNNTALITGASKRVGKALAEHLAAKGWNIIIHFNFQKNRLYNWRMSCAKNILNKNLEEQKPIFL